MDHGVANETEVSLGELETQFDLRNLSVLDHQIRLLCFDGMLAKSAHATQAHVDLTHAI